MRPAVLPPTARALLSDLLAFRHLFRHSYELTLDEAKLTNLATRWQHEGAVVKHALQTFAQLLADSSGESRIP